MPLSLGAKKTLASLMSRCGSDDSRAEIILEMMTEIYNAGYAAGHHDTVEGGYVQVQDCDKCTYHSGDVEALVSEMA